MKISSLSASSATPSVLNLLPSSNLSSSSNLLRLPPLLSFHPNVSSSTGRKLSLVLCSGEQPSILCEGGELRARGRRESLVLGFISAAATLTAASKSSRAENEDFRVYTDEVNKFQISVPLDWEVGTGEPSGFKSVTAFYPQQASAAASVSVVITGVGADFTRIESFGKVEEFAETLVSGLDRSWQKTPGVAAKLIDCKSSKGESRKHLYTALGMASNGWYNRLYTISGQFVDEESQAYGSKIQKVVSSFRFT
ncbi:unnamed protein product [Linum tenue]|uniref:PsbP C-terminal domain-containing protein n=1 Tax=Linum tenue TaxID=586396 RepID=A0AAV0H9U0_9ROSI|nr:unnamed protein product [Linum tenue]